MDVGTGFGVGVCKSDISVGAEVAVALIVSGVIVSQTEVSVLELQLTLISPTTLATTIHEVILLQPI